MAVIDEPADTPPERLRAVVQYTYPVVLLVTFVVMGAAHSLYKALQKEDVLVPNVKGPGGKPLPFTKRKREEANGDRVPETFSTGYQRVFRYCMLLATSTFFGAGANIAVRALYFRSPNGDHGWWCGQAKTVSPSPFLAASCRPPPPPSAGVARRQLTQYPRSSSLALLSSICTSVSRCSTGEAARA